MKKTALIVIAVIVLIIVMIGSWLVGSYNGMVNKQEQATTALSNVEATYQRRFDLLPNLTKVVKAYATHEKETFEEVAKARSAASQIKLDASNLTPEKLKQYQEAQGQVAAALGKLMVVSEKYPELKASENFKDLQIQLDGCENRINEARQKYNESVQTYNTSVRSFPTVIIAGMMGFDKMSKFEAQAGTEKAPVLDI